jgi:hypothetical protein
MRFLGRALRVFLPPVDDLPIVPPVVKFRGFDPSLRAQSEKRRRIADAAKQRANQIVSGARVGTLLRKVE